MSVVDRFICRREGHKPTVQLIGNSGLNVKSYITSCQRCGKHFELVPESASVPVTAPPP